MISMDILSENDYLNRDKTEKQESIIRAIKKKQFEDKGSYEVKKKRLKEV